jgi:mercuric ion transport protein
MKPDSPSDSDVKDRSSGRGALLIGGLSATLASTCCLGPLVLVTLGVSGAWISNLTLLEPYQPLFIGAAMVALLFACRRIWRPATDCAPGQVCAVPSVNRSYKLLFWVVVALVVLALGFPLIAPWFY